MITSAVLCLVGIVVILILIMKKTCHLPFKFKTQNLTKGFSVLGLSSILLFCNPCPIVAQEEFVAPEAQHITTFSFTQLTGGIIIMEALLDDFKDTLNFVLDTGSGGISLDSTSCAALNLKVVPSTKIVRGIAGMRTVNFTLDHILHFPGLDVDNLDFHINDYSILTSAYGLRIDGIIGYSFLRRYIVSIDYDKLQMEVLSPGTYKYPHGGSVLKPQFSTLPMQQAQIRDAEQVNSKFYFDMGAGLCMLLSSDLVKDSSLFLKKRKMYLTQAEGLGGKKDMLTSVVKEVRIGQYRFRNVPVYVFEDDYNVTSYPILGGLIGNDLLRRFNVILNYPEQVIYIKPNKHYTDSFDYSYTGLGIYLDEGYITVTDIVKGSPAQLAGFHKGDIIVAVENNFTNNIQAYKILMQNAKALISVIVTRDGELVELKLRVKSIL